MIEIPQSQSGSAIIPGSDTRTNVAYGVMPIPDQVSGIVLPASGVLEVLYYADWQESVNGAARAALFIGANQAQIQFSGGIGAQQAVTTAPGAGINRALHTAAAGLVTSGGYGADVTTGQIIGVARSADNEVVGLGVVSSGTVGLGGPCHIFAAAGTYAISVQFKSSSGSVTVSNRRLYVRVKT